MIKFQLKNLLTTKRYYLLMLTGVFLCTFVDNGIGQNSSGQDVRQIHDLDEVILESEELLRQHPEGEFAPNLMFQLSELYIERSRLRFQREMTVYEAEEETRESGQLDTLSSLPEIDFEDALAISYKLLEKYPNVHFRDKVLYRLAICHFEEGYTEKAINHFKDLIVETDDPELLEEANFRLGNHYFDAGDYQTSTDFYSTLLSSWDSPYFEIALYKLGWSYYNINDYANAISTFLYLIEDINLLRNFDTVSLNKTKADVQSEAIHYIASSFAEYGGPQKARDFLKELKERDYTEQIFMQLADLYQQRNYYHDAIETLRVLLDFYPNSPEAPKYLKEIVANYDLAGDRENANSARVEFVDDYGPESQWTQQIADDEVRTEVYSLGEQALYVIGIEALEKAQATKSQEDYKSAIANFRPYLKSFPDSEKSHKVQFYLSESLYEIGQYSEAADSYTQLMEQYSTSDFKEIASFNRILAYNQLLQRNGYANPLQFNLINFLGKDGARIDIIIANNKVQAKLLQASNDFAIAHPKSDKLAEVLMNYGQTLYSLQNYSMAGEIYQKVISDLNSVEFLPEAYTMTAQCYFKESNYEQAKRWSEKIIENFPDSTRLLDKAKKIIGSSQFTIAQNFLEKGDSTRAALKFEEIAETAPDPIIAEKALLEAALQYENLGNKTKATAIYEQVPIKFPHSKFRDECLFKAGLLSEELNDYHRAANNYLALFRTSPTSEYASKSLFSAARCYENIKDITGARRYYDQYIKTYNDDPDRYLQAAFRKGEIVFNQGSYRLALNDFQFVIDAYRRYSKNNIVVENYIPANAQFLIAEILFAQFQRIKLTPPIEQKLKRKKNKFEEVIKSYTEAAKFKVAEWSTASSYKIGATFEEFANFLLKSPRPQNLSLEDLEEYNIKLWHSVKPFKKKALDTYQANLKQAEKNNIQNLWVLQSRDRVQILTEELGLTGEQTEPNPGL